MSDAVLRFRLARAGLGADAPAGLAAALAAPAQDFQRDALLLALAARVDGVTRKRFDAAVETGEVVLAPTVRAALFGVAPDDFALWGRALLARDEGALGRQLGRQVQGLAGATGIPAAAMLDEVADATTAALGGGARLDRAELHQALRDRLREPLLPWCEGCGSHHVAPMLWRFALVKAGGCLDAERRYRLGRPGRALAAAEALKRFLAVYGPSDRKAFADWAGLAPAHAGRLWDDVAGELEQTEDGAVLAADAAALGDPPGPAEGTRLLPPGDPVLQRPNRALIAPDPAVRKRLFRPVASPGAVLRDGRLAGLWRVKGSGARLELGVERLGRLRRADVEEQAARVAAAKGAADVAVTIE